jgi:VanZ family protein
MNQFQTFWGISWFTIVKGWHFTEFAILTVLAAKTMRWLRPSDPPVSALVSAMLLCMLFAASDEWHQSFVPDRWGTVTDVLIDSLGVATAGLLLLVRTAQRNPRPDEIR